MLNHNINQNLNNNIKPQIEIQNNQNNKTSENYNNKIFNSTPISANYKNKIDNIFNKEDININNDYNNYNKLKNFLLKEEIKKKKKLDETNKFIKMINDHQKEITDQMNGLEYVLAYEIEDRANISDKYNHMSRIQNIKIQNIINKLKKELKEELNLNSISNYLDPMVNNFSEKTLYKAAKNDKLGKNLDDIYKKYEKNFSQNYKKRIEEETVKEVDDLIKNYYAQIITYKEMASKIVNKVSNMMKKIKKINETEEREKLYKINNFCKNVYNYQKIISEIIEDLKNEIKNNRIDEAYRKMKRIKIWLYFNINKFKEKMGLDIFIFDQNKIKYYLG